MKRPTPERRWEVLAPAGWQFESGEHSAFTTTLARARVEAKRENIFRCPKGCDCEGQQ